jgi:hypothetical protein
MAGGLNEREQALRRLPLPYSLALRLHDIGVATDVIGQYVNIDQAALDGLYRASRRISRSRARSGHLFPIS